MVTVNYSLVGANGDTLAFDEQNFLLNPGMSGFGIPSTSVRIDESAGDGGVWRHSKRGIRELDIPITVIGTDRNEVQEKLRRLAKITQDKTGATQLIATYSDGKQLKLEMHYVAGGESKWGGDDSGVTWCRWVMSFRAPQPYWVSTSTESFSIRSGNTGRGLLPQLSKLRVSSSSSLGTVTVSSSADVEAYPVWTITGPVTSFTASNGTQTFSFPGVIVSGETLYVNTQTGEVTDNSGANAYARLGSAPKLFPIQPGVTTIEITGLSTDNDTRIVCDYALRYEVVH
jgi:hypothetical protein